MDLYAFFPAKGQPIGPMGLRIIDPWAPLYAVLRGTREELGQPPYSVQFRGFLNVPGRVVVAIPVNPRVIDALRREEAASSFTLDMLERMHKILTD